MRRHDATRIARSSRRTAFAGLGNGPVPSNIQTRAASFIRERLESDPFYASAAKQTPPSIKEVQPFTVAGGGRRCYV